MNFVKYAKYNICFGQGGQLSSSMIFGKSTIYYYKILNVEYDEQALINNNLYHCKTIDSFLETINNKCSI